MLAEISSLSLLSSLAVAHHAFAGPIHTGTSGNATITEVTTSLITPAQTSDDFVILTLVPGPNDTIPASQLLGPILHTALSPANAVATPTLVPLKPVASAGATTAALQNFKPAQPPPTSPSLSSTHSLHTITVLSPAASTSAADSSSALLSNPLEASLIYPPAVLSAALSGDLRTLPSNALDPPSPLLSSIIASAAARIGSLVAEDSSLLALLSAPNVDQSAHVTLAAVDVQSQHSVAVMTGSSTSTPTLGSGQSAPTVAVASQEHTLASDTPYDNFSGTAILTTSNRNLIPGSVAIPTLTISTTTSAIVDISSKGTAMSSTDDPSTAGMATASVGRILMGVLCAISVGFAVLA